MIKTLSMTPFMKGPLGPPLGTHTIDPNFMNQGADMTPFMKGPLGPPERHIRRSNL